MLSVITPAFNESSNLPLLYQRLVSALESPPIDWEWIVVDDHSSDGTFDTIRRLAQGDRRVRGMRLARNFGSHAAISCGLQHARGTAVAVLSADLQDPPEALPRLLAEWQRGSQVVWAARARVREKTSGLYYGIMRRISGMDSLPATGADFFLLDRVVVDALAQCSEQHNSLFALITWMGFRQSSIVYEKEDRLHGQTGWTLKKKLALAVDSITAFTYAPIRMMTYAGIITALLGFAYAGFILLNTLSGHRPEGWASLMVVVLVVGGMQMLMMGVLGEYLWRALSESRRRPRFLVEERTEDS